MPGPEIGLLGIEVTQLGLSDIIIPSGKTLKVDKIAESTVGSDITMQNHVVMLTGKQFFFDGGTALLPGLAQIIAGVKDANSGIYAVGADNPAFTANGAQSANFQAGLVSVNGSIYIPGIQYLAPTVSTLPNAGTAIVAASTTVDLNNTSGGSLTLTAAPTIADGAADGQWVWLRNKSANDVVIRDQGTLANSNLRLNAASITLSTRDVVGLAWFTAIGDWVQMTPVSNVI